MAARFVNIDHDTPLLLPPDLRDWVPENHLVHFVMDAVKMLDLGPARINHRGTGDAQYPPAMMLGLLIYCYATGTFSSRKIERLTHENVAVRYLCADTHPDHDSICEFRRGNRALLESSFHQVLECAARSQVLRVGDITVALDGTKILANASKHSAVSHGHAVEQMMLLEEQIAQLLSKAEGADSTPLQDGLSIPEEVSRRRDRLAKLQQAVAVIEERAQARRAEELAAFESKRREREERAKATGKKPKGREPKAPKDGPEAKGQYNFTDPESRVMKAGSGEHFEQSYNAQAAVETESRLIIARHVVDAPNDKQQLLPGVAAISPVVESIAAVLVDSGYYSAAAVSALEAPKAESSVPKVYAATARQTHGRTVAQLEKRDDPAAPSAEATPAEQMAHRLKTQAGRALYALRKQTIEPVFGIIKGALGFRRFSLRGLKKVNLEWTLVSLSYNLKRLYHLGTHLQAL
jgi:transposase